MAIATTETPDEALRRASARMRQRSIGLAGGALAIVGYIVYAWVALDVVGVFSRANWENGARFAQDSVAYKVHVTKDMRGDTVAVTIENELSATYQTPPPWVRLTDDGAVVDLADGVTATIRGDAVFISDPSRGALSAVSSRRAITAEVPDDIIAESLDYEAEQLERELTRFARRMREFERREPTAAELEAERARLEAYYGTVILTPWLSAAEKRFDARLSWNKRVTVTGAKIEIHRFFYGWENFFFDFDSPLQSMSAGALAAAVFSGDRIDPAQSNISFIASSFWYNSDWRHGYIFRSLFETILMAFLGTTFAVLFGLPLAFLAARNFTAPTLSLRLGGVGVVLMPLRFLLRRLFDFLRGIDMLIWSLIFIRAFGLGPLTGTLAIAFTDTGSLGKLFSEALENVDNKQIEGVQATGAGHLQRYRWGVIPQMLPVFISQGLYFLESNTRSATVIGALGAGGIGLVLVETMNTRSKWEIVLYLIILTILVVILMDTVSGWLRRRLIEGSPERQEAIMRAAEAAKNG